MIEQYQNDVVSFLGRAAVEAAKKHASVEFPKESCGFIAGGEYVACVNVHKDSENFFQIDDSRYDEAVEYGTLEAVVHSHPNGPMFPSELDMTQQIASDVPWLIIMLNEDGNHKLTAWGDALPVPPVISRPFLHGILDCYTLMRDVFRLGHDELLKQGVHWPLPPILLDQVAREDDWWKRGDDHYQNKFEKFGFKTITHGEAQPGDCFLIALGDRSKNPKKQLNHIGVLLENDQILHQLPTDLSRRIPASLWAKGADMWIRYEGKPS